MNSRAQLTDAIRFALGLLLTPAIVPITSIVIAFLVTNQHEGECAFGYILAASLFVGFPASYFCGIIFGVPYIHVMHRRKHLNFWTLMAGTVGLWIGMFGLPSVVCLCATGQPRSMLLPGLFAVLYLPGMLLASAAFYGIAIRRHIRLPSQQGADCREISDRSLYSQRRSRGTMLADKD